MTKQLITMGVTEPKCRISYFVIRMVNLPFSFVKTSCRLEYCKQKHLATRCLIGSQIKTVFSQEIFLPVLAMCRSIKLSFEFHQSRPKMQSTLVNALLLLLLLLVKTFYFEFVFTFSGFKNEKWTCFVWFCSIMPSVLFVLLGKRKIHFEHLINESIWVKTRLSAKPPATP